jgi:hypothetical protein
MTRSNDKAKILVLIICVDGLPRNQNIGPYLSKNSERFDIRYIVAVEPKHIDSEILNNLKVNSEYLIGRRVTSVEIAVMLSHRKCYEILLKETYSYALILEDDVDILGMSLDIEPLEMLINTLKLRIITLAKSPWSSWKKYRSLEVAKFPPPCASCYLINEATASYALNFDPLGVADWPQWAHKVEFLYNRHFNVPIISSDSYINDLRSEALSKHNKYLIFTKTPKNSKIKKIWQIRYLVLYRAQWKLDAYFSKRSTKAFFKKVRKIW